MPPAANHRTATAVLGSLGGRQIGLLDLAVDLLGGGRPQRDVAERGEELEAGEAGGGGAVEEGAEEGGDGL